MRKQPQWVNLDLCHVQSWNTAKGFENPLYCYVNFKLEIDQQLVEFC